MMEAIVTNGIAENIIVGHISGSIPCPAGCGIGWTYDGTNFAPPVLPLPEAKAARIADINSQATAQIVGGFQSSATGTAYIYDSEQTDQLNLIGAVAAGVAMPWPCTDANGVKALVPHTAAELAQVLQDGAGIKQGILDPARAARDAVKTATNQAEIDAVVYP